MATTGTLRSLDVIVTSDCNLRCAYCYQNARSRRSISWGALRPALDLLLRSRRPRVNLLFIGGEPLLEFPLVRRAVTYVETRRRRNLRVAFSIATNGTLLGPREAEFLSRHEFDVQVSFDGVGNAQQLRGPSTRAALDALLDRLRHTQPELFTRRLSIAITVVPRTLPFLADSVDYFLAKGAPEVIINPSLTHHADWRHESRALLRDQFSRIYRTCLRHYRRTGLVPIRLFRRPSAGSEAKAPGSWLCGTGRGESLTVDVNGELSGCVLFARSYQRFPATQLGRSMDTLQLGPVAASGLGRRLAGYGSVLEATGLFHHREDKHSAYGRCARCRYRAECSVCPVCIVHVPGNEDPNRIPDFVCMFNRIAASYRRRFPPQPDAQAVLSGGILVPELVRDVMSRADGLERQMD